jgi:cytidine deaminase
VPVKIPKKVVDEMIAIAVAARKNAYCPLTGYAVGASLLGESGRIFPGCNVESPTGIMHACAERSAIFGAVSRGEKRIVAVCTVSPGSFPCGTCRQAILEFGGPDTPIYSVMSGRSGAGRRVKKTVLRKILPGAHSGDTVKRYSKS